MVLVVTGLVQFLRQKGPFFAAATWKKVRVCSWEEDLSITLLASQFSVCIHWPCPLSLAGTIFAISPASTEATAHWGSLLGSQWRGCLSAFFLPLVFTVTVLSQLLSQVSRLLRAGLGTKPPFILWFLWERSFQGPDIQMKRVFFFWKIHSPPVS